MREFDLIARIAARTGAGVSSSSGGRAGWGPGVRARDDVVLGLGDDAALLAPAPGMQLVACTDTLVRGVHYPRDTAPADIGWKALAVNLSDLAAMGAMPRWALLALTLPEPREAWLDAFLDGWCALAESSGIVLVGGDTTRGPETITVTVLGEAPSGAALLRSGAVAGDRVWVSGTLGDAAAALRLGRGTAGAGGSGKQRPHPSPPPRAGEGADEAAGLRSARVEEGADTAAGLHSARVEEGADTAAGLLPPRAGEGRDGGRRAAPETLRARLDRPTPRLALGRALRGIATACIDVSDGLLADLGHLCRASGVAAELQLAALPASSALVSLLPDHERWPLQLSGGDDYELCFTAPPSRDAALQQLGADLGLALTPVGRIVVGAEVRVLHADGRGYHAPRPGFEHFA